MTRRKRGLVLSGGGAKGAYQAGVYKCLRERGERFDIIVGTSIGSLNGMLIAQDDYEKMSRLWDQMEATKVMNEGIDIDFSLETIMAESDRIIPFLKKYHESAGADIAPLRKLIGELVAPERIRAAGIVFGCVTVKYPSLEPLKITLDQMGDDRFADFLIASASCYPVFPRQKIAGQEYIDGGYYDNVPIQFAYELGAKDLTVAELNYPKLCHPEYEKQPGVHTIRPSRDTGGFMDFGHEHLQHLAKLGYLDAARSYGMLQGHQYAFRQPLSPSRSAAIVRELGDLIHLFDVRSQDLRINPFSKKPLSAFVDIVNGLLPYGYDDQDYVIRLTENLMSLRKEDFLAVYDLNSYLRDAGSRFHEPLGQPAAGSFLAQLPELIASGDADRMIGAIAGYLDRAELSSLLLQIAALAPKQVTAALFIKALQQAGA